MIGNPLWSNRSSPAFLFEFVWGPVMVFGLCGAGNFKRLVDWTERLRIRPTGIRGALWSDQTIAWSEITDVTT